MKRKQIINALLKSLELKEDENQAYQYTLVSLTINVYEDSISIATRNTDIFSLSYPLSIIKDIVFESTERKFTIVGLDGNGIAMVSYDCLTDFDL